VAYQVIFNAHAVRSFRKLPRGVQERLKPVIDSLADTPRPAGVEKLSGADDAYRVRVANYRILYEIHDVVLLITIVEVGHRRDVYR
jgi:mRNA interferase RelE/StbE